MPNRNWSDLSPSQRTAIIASGSVQVALLVAALADIHRRPAGEVRGGKLVWSAASFVNFVGPVSYFLFGRRR